MKKKGLLFSIFLVVFFINKNFSQSKRVADRYFNKFAYVRAAKLYEAIYRKGDTSKYVLSKLADSYYNNASTKEAEVWYEKLLKFHKVEPDYLFKYAQTLRSNGNYKKSDSLLLILASDKTFNKGIENKLKKEDYLLDFTNIKGNRIGVRNLAINTEYSDFGGFLYNDEVYFASASSIRNSKKQKIYKWNNQPFLNIYKADGAIRVLEEVDSEREGLDSVFVLERKRILPPVVNTQYHESNPIFTQDGKTMYFTRVNYDGKRIGTDKKNTVNLKLFKTTLVNAKWTKPKELPFNSNEYSVGHPALSVDEKTLYFISDMPGGFGETDLYKVTIKKDGYGTPVNLGEQINTKKREMFPFIGSDNTLYFSSDGHLGIGLLDIFQTRILEDDTYDKVVNIGYPFNSKRDDFSFYIDREGRKGFFSSNRKKGKGDDDIYSFFIYKDVPVPVVCQQTIHGIVKDTKFKKPISLATVKMIDANNEVVREVVSDDKGRYVFENIPCDVKKYTIFGSKLNFKPDTEVTNNTTGKNGSKLKVDLELRPLIIGDQIVINPIYFDYDKSNIREDAQYELEDVVTVMNDNPYMVIKIESHTDSRGRDEYNRLLSDRRAKSTRDYIISRGIADNRIESAIGYGESQLLNHCNNRNRNKCTEEEHQLNRRSYFYIVRGGENVGVENKKPTVIDRSFNNSSRNRIKRKKQSRSQLLKLLNNFRREKSRMDEKDKCTKEDDECD